MKYKKICIKACLIAILVVGIIAAYKIYIDTIDTRYAVNFAKVFMGYDINDIDKYFSADTVFICNEEQKEYSEIRENIEIACSKKVYKFSEGGSYGYGNDKFINGKQSIKVLLHGEIDGENFGDCDINITLKKTRLFSFSIDIVQCNDKIFRYLFFGVR